MAAATSGKTARGAQGLLLLLLLFLLLLLLTITIMTITNIIIIIIIIITIIIIIIIIITPRPRGENGARARVPFGDHPLKLERRREDSHGPCARMTRTNREV